MALSFRISYTSNLFFRNLTKPVKWNIRKYPVRFFCNGVRHQRSVLDRSFLAEKELRLLPRPVRQCTTHSGEPKPAQEPEKKPGLIQRFKQMYKDYWYVLLPVHMTTSAIWFGGFYYLVSHGVDVVSWLESMGISEALLKPLKETGAGYFALALACYKLITPLRYAVTVGGTTYAINRLTAVGWIRPVPSRERLKEMIQERKDNMQDRFQESKQHYQTQIQEKKTQMMDEMRRYKTEIKNIKDRVKKM